MKRKFTFALCILTFLLTFTSCAEDYQTNDDFYGGESINADILSSIAESIFNETQADEIGEHQSSSTTHSEHDGIYYWTASGSVYHKWPDCGHLKNSSTISSGSKEEAILAGKEKLCSSCDKNN